MRHGERHDSLLWTMFVCPTAGSGEFHQRTDLGKEGLDRGKNSGKRRERRFGNFISLHDHPSELQSECASVSGSPSMHGEHAIAVSGVEQNKSYG
jgi:hypothetical protein